MSSFLLSSCLSFVAALWIFSTQVTGLLWPFRSNSMGNYDTAYSYQRPVATWGNNANWGSQWDNNRGVNTWSQSTGWQNSGYGGQYNKPKGSEFRRCYNSVHCNRGECCQYPGYSNSGICRYDEYGSRYGCQDVRPNPYPPNNKGGGWPPRQNGRPGSCPPPEHWRGPFRYCRIDDDCPAAQKCCSVQKNRVCQHAIFAGPS